eukprot:scaffold26963_cov155-Skeletonema_dohrnii-CCMP3373.AAC.4
MKANCWLYVFDMSAMPPAKLGRREHSTDHEAASWCAAAVGVDRQYTYFPLDWHTVAAIPSRHIDHLLDINAMPSVNLSLL